MALQPRAQGTLRISTKRAGARSVLDVLHQSGSSKLLFPRSRGHGLEAVVLNTAGGVTGGDRFALSARAGSGTTLTMTSQACERAYKAQTGETGHIRNRLIVETGARLNWVPQETILFDQSALQRRLFVELAPDAKFLMVEPVVFGRAAMGEILHDVSFDDRIDVRRDGVPLYLDALRLTGKVAAHLAKPFIANGAGAMASVLYVAPDAATVLDRVRAALPDTAGASLIRPGVLCVRMLATDSFDLRTSLLPVLRLLNSNDLPRCWMT